jgi:hypothetical protein
MSIPSLFSTQYDRRAGTFRGHTDVPVESLQIEGGFTLDVCPAPLATGHEYLDKD